MRARGLSLLIVAILTQLGSLQAQDDPCLRRVVPVNVLLSDGTHVRDMEAQNFKASIHGTPLKIISVTPELKPRRIMIVLDASGSMIGSGYWATYLQVAANLMESQPAGTLIGLIVFSTKVNGILPLTDQFEKLQTELRSLRDVSAALPSRGSGTALWDSIRNASQIFASPMDGDSIYALTDGGDNASKVRPGNLSKALVAQGIRLFSFAIENRDAGYGLAELNGPVYMLELVSDSGGLQTVISNRSLDAKKPFIDKSGKRTFLATALQAQFQLIPSYYRMELELPVSLQQATSWKLEVKGLKRSDLRVIYPQKLAACGGAK
jgi:hypothetical protein